MRWPFGTKKLKTSMEEKEFLRDLKIMESQRVLLEAAVATTEVANFVTTRLKSKLEDSMAQIESTARILNDALVITDLDGQIQAFNPAAEQMFGVTADNVRDTFVGSLFAGEFTNVSQLWNLLDKDEDEYLVGQRFGSTFLLDVNSARLDRSDGSSIMLLVLRDTTVDQKVKNYRAVFESSFDGILVVKDEHIVAANPAATKLFGYSVEELMTKSLGMLIVTKSEDEDQPIEVKHQDGHIMELFFTMATICWNGETASLVTIKSIFPTEETITSENMICTFNSDFRITFANNSFAKFYNTRRDQIIGTDIRNILPKEECNPLLINVSSLSPSEPTRRLQLSTTNGRGQQQIQNWTDHASYDEIDVEYQRIGYVTTKAQV